MSRLLLLLFRRLPLLLLCVQVVQVVERRCRDHDVEHAFLGHVKMVATLPLLDDDVAPLQQQIQ
jgi:hypothetical protein